MGLFLAAASGRLPEIASWDMQAIVSQIGADEFTRVNSIGRLGAVGVTENTLLPLPGTCR